MTLLTWFIVDSAYPNLAPKRFAPVVEGALYRSGQLTPAAMRAVVERHGLRTVVDLRDDDPSDPVMRRARLTAQALGVERVVMPLNGWGTGDPNSYANALRVMSDPDRHPVLVHCAAGTERTGCAVALFRTIVEGADAETALAESVDRGHDPEDNPRMHAYFHEWRDEIAASLRTGAPVPTQHAPRPEPTMAP